MAEFITPVQKTTHRSKHHGSASTESLYAELLTKTLVLSVAQVTFNDDEAERRQRRLNSNLCTYMSPGCHTPRSAGQSTSKRGQVTVESATSSLTNSQLKDHYANCIKLSSQNKINSKNAFGLHLIDHMLQLLTIRGEMTNFQVASSTLDASAKIYAGRVDSIYTDAFKVLTSFGRETHGQGTDKGEGVEDECDAAASKAPKTGKSRKANAPTIEKNTKNLNINTFDFEYEIDPLFKKTAARFDEGGVEGLLINHLQTDGQSYSLSLDSDEVPCYVDQPTTSVDIDVRELKKLISLADVRTRQLCPTFVSLFTKDVEGDAGSMWNEPTRVSSSADKPANQNSDIGAEYSMLPSPPEGEGCPDHDGGLDDTVAVGGVEVTSAESTDITALGTCSDDKVAGFISSAPAIPTGGQQFETSSEGLLGPLCLSEAIQTSDYSYFAPSVLATWAGPRHWKIHPKSIANDGDGKSKKKRQPPVQFKIDFNQTPDKTPFTKGKAAAKLSKRVLTKRNHSQTTLPEDPHTKSDVLHKLFSRPKWEVRRRQHKPQSVDDPLDGNWYDYGNLHDNANYCPQMQDDIDGEVHNASVDEPLSLSQGEGFYDQTLDGGSQETHPGAEFVLTGDGLVAQPRQVEKINIEYDRTAKRLDIKKLKHKMWEVLSPADNIQESELPDGKEVFSDKVSSFSTLCRIIPSQLSNEMRRNVSVPICFVCLLHLANEKDMMISGTSDLSDLEIVAGNTT